MAVQTNDRSSRPPVDADLLPSDTGLRFAVLAATLFAANASIYRHVSVVLSNADAVAGSCLQGVNMPALIAGVARSPLGAAEAASQLTARCASPFAASSLLWTAGSVVGFSLLTWVVMGVLPVVSRWRRRLTELDRRQYAQVAEHLDALADQLGLTVRPQYWEAPEYGLIDGRAFGTSRHPQVSLTTGLICELKMALARGAATQQVDAVVLHELAHIARRDVGRTYLAVASWWVFVAVDVVPFLVTSGWRLTGNAAAAELRAVVTTLILIGLVYLSRMAVLRNREYAADALAATADRAALAAALPGPPRQRAGRRAPRIRWLAWHPDRDARLTAIGQPHQLLTPSLAALAVAGVSISVINTEITGAASFLLGVPGGVEYAIAGVALGAAWIAGAASWLLVISGWRAAAHGQLTGKRPKVLIPAMVLTAGVLAGEPLAISTADTGVWGTVYSPSLARGLADELAAAVLLAVILCGLSRWAADTTLGWVAVTGRSLRQRCVVNAVIGGLALLPAILVWVVMHRMPSIAQLHPYTPGTPSVLIVDSHPPFRAPWAGWIEAQYYPLENLAFQPWTASLLALPALTICIGGRRLAGLPAFAGTTPPPVGPAVRAGLLGAGGYLVVATVIVALLRRRLHGWYIRRLGVPALSYFTTLDTLLIIGCAALVAIVVAARHRHAGTTLALLASLVTAVIAAAATPVLLAGSIVGPGRMVRAAEGPGIYAYLYGMVGMSAPARVAVICAPVALATTVVVDRVRPTDTSRSGPPPPVIAQARWLGYTTAVLVGTGLLLGAVYGWRALF